jgi:hypothetical protein
MTPLATVDSMKPLCTQLADLSPPRNLFRLQIRTFVEPCTCMRVTTAPSHIPLSLLGHDRNEPQFSRTSTPASTRVLLHQYLLIDNTEILHRAALQNRLTFSFAPLRC